MTVRQENLVINVGQDLFGEVFLDGRVKDGIVARVVLGSKNELGKPRWVIFLNSQISMSENSFTMNPLHERQARRRVAVQGPQVRIKMRRRGDEAWAMSDSVTVRSGMDFSSVEMQGQCQGAKWPNVQVSCKSKFRRWGRVVVEGGALVSAGWCCRFAWGAWRQGDKGGRRGKRNCLC